MRSWVLSAWLIAPVWTKWTRPSAKTGAWGRAASQIASRQPGPGFRTRPLVLAWASMRLARIR